MFGGIAHDTSLGGRGRVHRIAGFAPPSILLLRGRLQPSGAPIKSPVSGGGDTRGRTRCVVRRRGWESGGAGAGAGLVGNKWYGRGRGNLPAIVLGISSSANPLTSFSALSSPELLLSLIVLLGSVNVSAGISETTIESAWTLVSLGEVGAVGDTEDTEVAASSLSALMLNRNFERSLGADDLRPKNILPPVVGEIVGAEEAPFKPVAYN